MSRKERVTVSMCLINGAVLGDRAEASGCGNSSTPVNHATKSIKPNLAPAIHFRTQ